MSKRRILRDEKVNWSDRTHNSFNQLTVPDVCDAAIELVLNSDDAFTHLDSIGGLDESHNPQVTIEICGGRKKWFAVRDNCCGLTEDEFFAVKDVGSFTSKETSRGVFGSGLKACSSIGEVFVDSIKDGMYWQFVFADGGNRAQMIESHRATKADRRAMCVGDGNGLSVRVMLKKIIKLPRGKWWRGMFPRHYALRDIIAGRSPRLYVLEGGKSNMVSSLVPPFKKVFTNNFTIKWYGVEAEVRLRLYKTRDGALLPDRDGQESKLLLSGMFTKGENAYFDNSWPSTDIKVNPYAGAYFAELECPYLQDLLREHEMYNEQKLELPEHNPAPIADITRSGLNTRHPFVQKLLKMANTRLIKHFSSLSDQSQSAVSNNMHKVCNKAMNFFNQFVQPDTDCDITNTEEAQMLQRNGILICPQGTSIKMRDNARSFTVYASKQYFDTGDTISVRLSDPGFARVVRTPRALTQCQRRTYGNVLSTNFMLDPLSPTDEVLVEATGNGRSDVISVKVLERSDNDVWFGKTGYRLDPNSSCNAGIYVEPGIITQDGLIRYASSDPSIASVLTTTPVVKNHCNGHTWDVPIQSANEGRVIIEAKLIVGGEEYDCQTNVNVTYARRRTIDVPKFTYEFDDDPAGSDFYFPVAVDHRKGIVRIFTKHPMCAPFEYDRECEKPATIRLLYDFIAGAASEEQLRKKFNIGTVILEDANGYPGYHRGHQLYAQERNEFEKMFGARARRSMGI